MHIEYNCSKRRHHRSAKCWTKELSHCQVFLMDTLNTTIMKSAEGKLKPKLITFSQGMISSIQYIHNTYI